MTKKDRLRACELRINGQTWSYIGRELGYEADAVYKDIKRCIFGGEKDKPEVVYPLLKKLLEERLEGSVYALSVETEYTYWLVREFVFGMREPSDKFKARCSEYFMVEEKELFSK